MHRWDAAWSPHAITWESWDDVSQAAGHPAHLPAHPGTPARSGRSLWVYFDFLVCNCINRALPWPSRRAASSHPGAACSGCIAASRLCTRRTGQPRSASSRAISHPEILCSEIIWAIAMPSFSSRGGRGPFGSDTILICQCRSLLLQQLPTLVNSLAAAKDAGGNRSA